MGLFTISASIRRCLTSASDAKHQSSATKASAFAPLSAHDATKPETASKLANPSKTMKPLKPTKQSRNAASRGTTRRPRIKDLTAAEFANLLATMDTVPTPEQTAALADRVVSDGPFFAHLVSLLVNPTPSTPSTLTTHNVPARTRLHTPWAIATLLTHGSPRIREALAETPALLRSLASVFDVKQGALDAAHASLIAQVLRSILHQHSRQVATALQRTRFLPSLVRHVGVQPAADLLPRFVGTRVFSSLLPSPLLPAHKRAVAAMGAAKVQRLLADRFVAAASDMLDANSSDGLDTRAARRVAHAAAVAMAEVATRAAHLALKQEDMDERTDAMYAGNLGLVTSAVFNDAKRHLDLLHDVQPVSAVLQIAFTEGVFEADVIVPALHMVTAVLREARLLTAQVGNVAHEVKAADVSTLGAALSDFTPQLVEMLATEDEANKVGHVRLAVVDYICELAEGLDEASVAKTLCSDKCTLMGVLLNLASRFPRNNMLQVRVAKLIQLVFSRFGSVARAVLIETEIVSTLLELWEDMTMESAVVSMICWTRSDKLNTSGLDMKLQKQINMLDTLMKQANEKKVENAEEDAWAMFDARGKAGMTNTMRLDALAKESLQLSVSEDFGQELYMHALLEELSSQGDKAPPADDFVTNSKDVEAEGWD